MGQVQVCEFIQVPQACREFTWSAAWEGGRSAALSCYISRRFAFLTCQMRISNGEAPQLPQGAQGGVKRP